MTLPTVEEIDRIARLSDPILRNLEITQCYYEISQGVAERTGFSANWCTFATWASRQAGQTIRQEDLLRAFEERFFLAPDIAATLEELNGRLTQLGSKLQACLPRKDILETLHPAAAFARASDAVARGNKKVFEEIGREFARFLQVFRDDERFDRDRTERFCAALRPGEPPEGQRLLREAFMAYGEARFQNGNQNGKEKAELMLLANLAAGYHEQIRLQPEIAEALDAALGDFAEFKRNLISRLLPDFLPFARAELLLGRTSHLDTLLSRLTRQANRLIREVITEHLMTLHVSDTEVLRLGRDLAGPFPQPLAQIRNPKVAAMLAQVDPTPNSLGASGAADWANFTDRMHYITDFFRVYQERQHLFDAPFTARQVEQLKSGQRPEGRL